MRIIICLFVFLIITDILETKNAQPIVDLPEEYALIDSSDCLRGYYKNGILFIEFKN
jgi:hypothetical protein